MTQETHKFSTETDKIFKLMVHSLYENKDIFIRELISNASDACDKLRFESQQNPDILGNLPDINITVSIDAKNKTLTISDTGIGMSKEELIENLGTIAKSGTQKFLEELSGDAKKDASLIGQFGVGFYSAFMVADKLSVISQKAGSGETYIWYSEGNSEYMIEKSAAAIGRGTQITLHIKEGEEVYLDKFKVKSIIDAYSSHIAYEIYFTEEDGKRTMLNNGQAIWLQSKSEISEEEYSDFYSAISHGDKEPLMTLHTKAEGVLEYSSLLFIPSIKPFDLYHPDRQTRVKLYIKRVLISDNISIIPQYLRFLRGVVDSNDLPLNISRETIQNNVIVQKIKTAITKKTLKELTKKLENERDEYLKFWNNYGAVLKEGLCDGFEPRDEILQACLFTTNKSETPISLKEYKERMKEGQKAIYFINAETRTKALASPQIEGFKNAGYEVILLTDSVDDFWVNVVPEYDSTPLKSVTRSATDLEAEKTEENNNEKKSDAAETENKTGSSENLTKLCEYIKTLLGDKIKEVKVSRRLAESPVCLSVPEGGMDIRLERFMIENKQLAGGQPKILEINPSHQIIKSLESEISGLNENGVRKNKLDDTIKLLFAQANIVEGEPLEDIKEFTSNLNRLIEMSLAA